jgi:hypothetical protein
MESVTSYNVYYTALEFESGMATLSCTMYVTDTWVQAQHGGVSSSAGSKRDVLVVSNLISNSA